MSTIASSATRKAAGIDDVSLLLTMADKGINQVAAEEALKEFFVRHHPLLKAFAEERKFRSLGFDVDDFVMQTFEKAYKNAAQFEPGAEIDPEKITKKVRTWLFGIMRNEWRMELRKGVNKNECLCDEEPGETKEAEDESHEKVPEDQIVNAQTEEEKDKDIRRDKAAVRTFRESLPEKDQVLLDTSMQFYDFKLKKAMIPKDILEGMAKALGTTPEGIKQKRKRLLESLRDYVQKHT